VISLDEENLADASLPATLPYFQICSILPEAPPHFSSECKYTCHLFAGGVEVGLKPVPIESPLGQLRGTANMLELHSEYFREAPLVVQGCGAGGDPTASGMLADIIELAHTSPPP
jgi:hypothetical protein